MVTENSSYLISDMGTRTMISSNDGSYGEDYMVRSGSAPPTVEGSLSAVGGLFGHGGGDASHLGLSGVRKDNGCLTEEELRSDPDYLRYYYSNVNMNPRLPPPVLSKEDWRSAQRFQGGSSALGGIGDRRKVQQQQHHQHQTGIGGNNGSLFSLQPGFNSQQEESEVESTNAEWGGNGLVGFSGLGLGGRQKSFADMFQDDVERTTNVSVHSSRPASRNEFDNDVDKLGSAESRLAQLHHELVSNGQGISGVQHVGVPASHTFASVVGGSLSRSTTPDPQLVARAPSPRLPPIGGGKLGGSDNTSVNGFNSFNGVSSSMSESADLVASLSGMSLSRNGVDNEENYRRSQIQQEIDDNQNFLFNLQGGQNQIKQHPYMNKSDSGNLRLPSISEAKLSYSNLGKDNGADLGLNNYSLVADEYAELQKSANPYFKAPSSTIPTRPGAFSHYQNVDTTNSAFTNYGLSGYSVNPAFSSVMGSQIGTGNLPPLFEDVAAASAVAASGVNSRAFGGLNRMSSNYMDELYLQYTRTAEYAAQVAALNNPSVGRNYMENSYADILDLQKAYLGALLSPHKSQSAASYVGISDGVNQGYYGNPSFGLGGMSYSGSPMASPILSNSPVGPGSPMRHNERNMRFVSGMRNIGGGVMGSWHSEVGADESFASSLLEEFKNNKTRSFELSEIAGHVVEFSADQYGSRFIQQKLETASTEEKNIVFQEIIPQALSLMTDVFGNYVIQKFFEHGTAPQRRELANKLTGHVLNLSLQMYGCRVIQKAIEVVDLDQQTEMVAELDGNIMRCVRDQNGNHVIQKCIECIPQDAIQFIVSSFYDQVVTLSTHPYGCRVIQRVLEHCDDAKTQQIMMDEIFQSVCMLAQDQYGNYVVQHVLEFGKPHERAAIIKKLAGQIVQMSQQKFASNVVEKCLTFGGPVERQILVNEMLGTTDENEPLQAMMKDQFANYVVQKVLETCDDQHRELILSRIKVHLNALKKYTYGKHIVARVEKLVTAGERRMGLHSAAYPSA